MKILTGFFSVKRKHKRAQAFYEFIVSLTILPLFIAIILSLTRCYVAQIRCLQAARHGAFLAATGKVKNDKVIQEVKQYLQDAGFNPGKANVYPTETRIGFGCPASKVRVTYKVTIFRISGLTFWGNQPKWEFPVEEFVVCGKLGQFGPF